MIDLDFSFSAPLWEWRASGTQRGGSWHFITLPKDISQDIKTFTKHNKTGFGSVRVTAIIGDTKWNTSLFPSKEKAAYLLPVKAAVRKSEKIGKGSEVKVNISVLI